MANVISFCRVTHVLHAYELFGPMQISLTRMIGVSLCNILVFTPVNYLLSFAYALLMKWYMRCITTYNILILLIKCKTLD